jgi:hypothetical protein
LAVEAGNRVLLLDTAARRPPADLPHAKDVMFAAFGRDRTASVLVTAAYDQVYLWDPEARSQIRPPLRHEAWVAKAAISPDGRHVLALGSNGVLMGWQVTGKQLDPDATARLVRLVSCTAVGRDEVVTAGPEQLQEDWDA